MAAKRKNQPQTFMHEQREIDSEDARTKGLDDAIKEHLETAKGVVKMLAGAQAANKAGRDESLDFMRCAADQGASLASALRNTCRVWTIKEIEKAAELS